MRMFLNAIFDFKRKDNAFVAIPAVLREVLSWRWRSVLRGGLESR